MIMSVIDRSVQEVRPRMLEGLKSWVLGVKATLGPMQDHAGASLGQSRRLDQSHDAGHGI